MKSRWLLWACCTLIPAILAAQDLQEFEKKITEFDLPNGLHFIVLRRPQAPVVSMVTQVNVGSANDPAGKTGLAHMLEHMAFKGTDSLGTNNWLAEKKWLSDVESTYDKLEIEKNKGPRGSAEAMKKLEGELKAAIEKANGYVVKEAYSKIVSQNGGVGMNASTSNEVTTYFYSLPSNRIELWFLLTSQVFRQPIMREFYKERDVVREERRRSFESNPQGKMQDVLLTTAFLAHPQRTLIGWASDIENLRARDAEALFKTYYVPSNMVMVLAGDVDPAEMKRLAQVYFGGIPAGPAPPRIITEEPKQEGERRTAVEAQAQPFVYIGYKRPEAGHADAAPLSVLAGAMSGRAGILYKELVEEKKVSLVTFAADSFIGGKFQGLFTFIVVPAAGKTGDDNEKALNLIIERMKKEKVDQAILDRVKTQVRAGLVRALDSNMGMAQRLASNYILYGDWRRMFTRIQEVDKVTADDVLRVAKTYLIDNNKTAVYLKTPGEKKDGDKEAAK
ncbi:MAG: insulinase family protein [Acidobacteria bacterium]|nr:insulinase family protein [Acidobacteriota bacterium]